MIEAAQCPHCGAPLQELVNGACPFCRTVLRVPDGTAVPERVDGVVLVDPGRNLIGVIKELRRCTGYGLAEAKALAESATAATPQAIPLEAGVTPATAAAALRSAGATVRGPG